MKPPQSIFSAGLSAGLSAVLSAVLTVALLFSAPLFGADGQTCQGTVVTHLGGAHAVARPAFKDLANLQRRLPELEASFRAAVAKDPSLGPDAADALLDALRSGTGVTQRSMRRDEPIHWMAYQPKPGQFGVLAPACLQLGRSYDAFEVTVMLPGKVAAAQPKAECRIQATRDCTAAGTGIVIDLQGSSPNATVSLDIEGQPTRDLGARGERWTFEDPGPYDATLTVRAQVAAAAPPPARALHFLIPKICGNLTYLGETSAAPTPAEGDLEPILCERSVHVAQCAVTAPPTAMAPEPMAPKPTVVADRCEAGWVARGFLLGLFPTGSDLNRDLVLASGPAWETFSLDSGYGLGASLERRFGLVVGLEVAALAARGDSEYRFTQGGTTGTDTHSTNFLALTVGPNFHFLGCDGVDLYAGPFVGYGGFADPNYRVAGNNFVASFDRDFLWGAQLGLDVPFRGGPWAFHAGLRYLELDQDTDGGPIAVDPLLVELGLAYQF